MFDLTDDDLAGRVLGCGDGPASFNAEASALGHRVVSCDPIYAFSGAEIERRVRECYGTVISQLRENAANFVWDYFRDPDHLGECRLAVMRRFVADFEKGKGEGRYVVASLPALPFADGQFSLTLVSHLLFLYSEQLDLGFHVAAIEELLRVAREVRIFPLLGLDRKWSPHVGPVTADLERGGFVVEVTAVDYEFQKADDHAGTSATSSADQFTSTCASRGRAAARRPRPWSRDPRDRHESHPAGRLGVSGGRGARHSKWTHPRPRSPWSGVAHLTS